MKQKLNRFTCDNPDCSKCVEMIDELGYPYSIGWLYIYSFQFKIDDKQQRKVDMHFCSNKCALVQMSKWIGINGVIIADHEIPHSH